MYTSTRAAAALLTLACFVPTFGLAAGPFAREGSTSSPTAAAEGFFTKSSGQSFGHDEHGRVTSITDVATGASVQIVRDAAGRATETHGAGHTTTWHYANAASLKPSMMIRDGVPFRITQTGAHSVVLQKLAKGTITADSVDIVASINGAGDFMDSCAANTGCSQAGGDANSNWNFTWQDFWNWATNGGIAGGAVGFWGTYLTGVSALDVLASATAVFGIIGSSAAVVGYGGYQVGTWIYGRYGEAFWIRFAP
jgi:hypothetical protein